MKKISFNFSDFQHDEFRALAKRDHKSFAEVVRRALDEWLSSKKKGTNMSVNTSHHSGATVALHDVNQGNEGVLNFDDVVAVALDGQLELWREDRLVARFAIGHVTYWYSW